MESTRQVLLGDDKPADASPTREESAEGRFQCGERTLENRSRCS
jgi:hypothetical protein